MKQGTTPRTMRFDRADIADLLTFSRMLISPVIAWLLASQHLDIAVVLLGFAWVTDFLDGRLARSTKQVTRLHRWDLRADAGLGICLVGGLGLGGYLTWWIVIPLTGLMIFLLLLASNPAPVALNVGILFGTFILVATIRGDRLWWLPVVYMLTALVMSWQRLFKVLMPVVFTNLLVVRRPKTRPREIVLDDLLER